MSYFLYLLKINWKLLVLILTPVLLSVILITCPVPEARCSYVILIMAIYWMTEALPLGMTALIPVFAFPLLGVLPTAEVCIVYMKDSNVMFLGGLAVAVAVEYSQLHKRISLMTILAIGQSPVRLMIGFMLTTMFLSMWISNTATTAMMMPILKAVLQEIENQDDGVKKQGIDVIRSDSTRNKHRNKENKVNTFETEALMKQSQKFKKNQDLRDMYFLAIAYASNIGGTGSITGTGPNVVVKDFLESNYSEGTGLNFASWMLFNVPGMLICVGLACAWLQILFIYIKKAPIQTSKEKENIIKKLILDKYKNLGPITEHEITVLVLFIALVLLWLFRAPEFIPGWASLFSSGIKDATPAMFIALLLFVLPKKYSSIWSQDSLMTREKCLTWKILEAEIPWGVLLLLGGGFAVAKASKVSGLNMFLGEKLTTLQTLPPAVIVMIISIMAAMVTEVASNTATASIIIPILNELATSLKLNPLYLMLPAAISCSYAFMLPVATAPNAIVFENAKMKITTMMTAGVVMNVLCVIVINIMVNTYGIVVFDLMNEPAWINSTVQTV